MSKSRLPPQVFGQPHVECELLDYATRTLHEAFGVKRYFDHCGTEVDAQQLAHQLWAVAYAKTRRIGANKYSDGTVRPVDFQWVYLRELFDWVAEHLAPDTASDSAA